MSAASAETGGSRRAAEAERLAASVLMPGFIGTEPPEWLVKAAAGGLRAVLYFGHNFAGDTALLSERLHRLAPDMIVASDEEGGAVSRLHADGPSPYPSHAELGEVDDTGHTWDVAYALGTELAGLGIDAALSPVVDVNSDPLNPVIGPRAFGDRADLAARHGAAFVAGLRAAGRLSAAKHFPGHGDTRVDSHVDLPVIDVGADLLAERDLVPFARAVRSGADMVMVGHIVVPAIDAAPASASPAWYRRLRDEIGFTGAAITDAVDMRGLARFTGAGDPIDGAARGAVAALAAGADLLCLGNPATAGGTGEEAYRGALEGIVEAVRTGAVPHSRLVEAAGRVDALAAARGRGTARSTRT